MTKVCCIREIINHDGKQKYLQEYGTNHTIGMIIMCLGLSLFVYRNYYGNKNK